MNRKREWSLGRGVVSCDFLLAGGHSGDPTLIGLVAPMGTVVLPLTGETGPISERYHLSVGVAASERSRACVSSDADLNR